MKKTLAFILWILTFALLSTGCSLLTRNKEAISSVKPGNNILIEQTTDADESALSEQTALQTEADTPNTEAPEITKSDIVGTWMSVHRDGNTLYTHSLNLEEDGTVSSYGCEYYNAYYAPFGDETGWYTAPMGFPGDYGTYTLNGTTLEMTYTHADYGEYEEPYTDTIVISSIEDGKMTVDNRYGIYLYVEDYTDVLTLCQALGVDYSAG